MAVSGTLDVASAPPPARAQERWRQEEQQPYSKAEGLQRARRVTDQAIDAFEAVKEASKRPPTVAVYEATRYASHVVMLFA